MDNFTATDKATLDTYLRTNGKQAFYVAYDPNTVTGDPEADAIAHGLTEYHRSDAANLVEVIYTAVIGSVQSIFGWGNLGVNYEVDDLIYLVGLGSGCILRAASVDGNGSITSFDIVNAGGGYANGTYQCYGGSGTGLTDIVIIVG